MCLPGDTNAFLNPMVALSNALDATNGLAPILIVILCQNYRPPNGFLMNCEAFSAYPDEGEFLLMENCQVRVLSVDHLYKIKNNYSL